MTCTAAEHRMHLIRSRQFVKRRGGRKKLRLQEGERRLAPAFFRASVHWIVCASRSCKINNQVVNSLQPRATTLDFLIDLELMQAQARQCMTWKQNIRCNGHAFVFAYSVSHLQMHNVAANAGPGAKTICT